MKTKITLLAVFSALALAANAQDNSNNGPDGGRPPGGPGMGGHRPPPPIMLALDANHDGVIDADEIANAPAALKTLDKNGDGKLTQDELRPPRPSGAPDHGNDAGGPPDGGNPPPQQ